MVTLAVAGSTKASVVAVGVDSTTAGNWRTAAINGGVISSEYGTDGYVIYALQNADSIYEGYNPAVI